MSSGSLAWLGMPTVDCQMSNKLRHGILILELTNDSDDAIARAKPHRSAQTPHSSTS